MRELETRRVAAAPRSPLASSSVPEHVVRGVIGFGVIALSIVLASTVSPAMLLLAPLGMVSLRGCPTCWTIGLIETISARRLARECGDDGCRVRIAGGERSGAEV